MPYTILNKRQWMAEMESLSDKYIEYINKLTTSKSEVEIDVILSKKYKSNDLIFTGKEILEAIQKKLANDETYIYEFRVIDNKPIVKKTYRVLFDDYISDKDNSMSFTNKSGTKHTIKNDNIINTIEDLKSKYVEALMEIDNLKLEIDKKEDENKTLFMELIDASGGIYKYVSKKKLILMLSKILKELGFYQDEKGTQYSYEELTVDQKHTVDNILYGKVYK